MARKKIIPVTTVDSQYKENIELNLEQAFYWEKWLKDFKESEKAKYTDGETIRYGKFLGKVQEINKNEISTEIDEIEMLKWIPRDKVNKIYKTVSKQVTQKRFTIKEDCENIK